MICNVFIVLRCFTILVAILWASANMAGVLNVEKSFCEKKAEVSNKTDPEYDRAMLSVTRLPEFLQVEKDIRVIDKRNSMPFGSMLDGQYETTDGKCYWQVTVYVNLEDENRMMLWHTFLVDKNGKIESINDLEGDYISLRQWRSSNLLK